MAAFWPIGTAQNIRIVSYPIRKKSRFWLFYMWSDKEMYHALFPWETYRDNRERAWSQAKDSLETRSAYYLYGIFATNTGVGLSCTIYKIRVNSWGNLALVIHKKGTENFGLRRYYLFSKNFLWNEPFRIFPGIIGLSIQMVSAPGF